MRKQQRKVCSNMVNHSTHIKNRKEERRNESRRRKGVKKKEGREGGKTSEANGTSHGSIPHTRTEATR